MNTENTKPVALLSRITVDERIAFRFALGKLTRGDKSRYKSWYPNPFPHS